MRCTTVSISRYSVIKYENNTKKYRTLTILQLLIAVCNPCDLLLYISDRLTNIFHRVILPSSEKNTYGQPIEKQMKFPFARLQFLFVTTVQ